MTLQFLLRKSKKKVLKNWTAHFPHFFKFAVEGSGLFFFFVFFLQTCLSPAICLTIARRSGRVGCWLAAAVNVVALVWFFFLSTRFFVSVSGYFPPFSLICRRELVRLAKERKGESERRRTKKRYEPSGSFRLLYRRFNVSAVVKGRQTMSSVSHLSLSLSLSGILSYLVSYLQRYITTHTRTRKKTKKTKTFRVVLSRGPKSSKYIDSSPCLRFLLRYNSCCLRICRARINPCVSLRSMPRDYKPV
jgi:hypothetical protein